MSSTVFVDQVTPVPASWLNDVNTKTYADVASTVNFTQLGTGAVIRTVQNKLQDTISVKDFGAIGNGIADDTAAMNLAHATGSVVYYPTGTYKFTTLSPITSGGIKGDGRAYTTLVSTDIGSSDLITFNNSNYSPTFEDFILKAPVSSNLPVKTGGSGIVLSPASGEIGYAYFCNVTIAYLPTCVQFVKASYWLVDNCEFLGYSAAGLDINNTNNADSGDSVITGCIFNTPGTTGACIIHRASGGLKVVGNKLLGGANGYSMQFSGGKSTSVLLFTANSVENMAQQCMAFSRVSGTFNFSNVVITGNEFGVSGTGIQDDASTFINEMVVVGNVFNLNTAGTGYGLNLNSITDFTISGNTFKGNGGGSIAGITIGASCTNGKVAATNTYTTLTSTVSNSSTSTLIDKNAQSGRATTSSSGWSSYGGLFSSPTVSVTFATPFLTSPSQGEIQLTASSTNGAVSAIITALSTAGFSFIGVSAVTNIAATYDWRAYGIK